jgi:hypothetical protein
LTSRCQLKESAKIPGGLHAHDEALHLLALLFADDIAAERREFHGDLAFGHRIAWIALGTSTRVECDSPLLVVMVTRLGWNLGKSASNSWLAATFLIQWVDVP